MMKSIDSGQQMRDGYFNNESNKSAVQVDGFQLARNNLEQQSDSSEDESSYTSGNKRKKEKPTNIEKVPRKSIRKKPDKVPPKGGTEKEKGGVGDKKLL